MIDRFDTHTLRILRCLLECVDDRVEAAPRRARYAPPLRGCAAPSYRQADLSPYERTLAECKFEAIRATATIPGWAGFAAQEKAQDECMRAKGIREELTERHDEPAAPA